MLRTYRYRLYPSKAQAKRLAATLETTRRFYNDCLAERKAAWEAEQRSVTKTEQLRGVAVRKATDAFAAIVHSHILQVACADLDKAFRAFFQRVKAGETPGYPRFKGRNRFDSFGLKEYGNGFKIDGRRLRLHGIGRVAVRWHRALPGTPKTVRILRRASQWYAAFVCETEAAPLATTGREVGIDVGITHLIATSDGETVEGPAYYRHAQRKLRVAQRCVARRTKGGANRRKAVLELQRLHAHTANQRTDFLNKLAHQLITMNDVVVLEDLHISNMVKNRHLAKSILDSGWGYLFARLTHKAEEAGRTVALVDSAYTSKMCSGCGLLHDLSLADRWLACGCGVSLDRDHNAAINILQRYRAGQVRWALSPPVGGLAQEAAGRSSVRSVTSLTALLGG